jgi:hypothetical protein
LLALYVALAVGSAVNLVGLRRFFPALRLRSELALTNYVPNTADELAPVLEEPGWRPRSFTVTAPPDAVAAIEPPAPVSVSDPVDVRPLDVIYRNDPCWCGSGKKYKKCHGA